MKRFIKKYSFIIISFILSISFCTTIFVLFFSPTKYDIIVPSLTNNLNSVYNFDNIDTSKFDINTVAVSEYVLINKLDYLFVKNYKYASLSKHNDLFNTDYDFIHSSGTVEKNVSITNGIIAGFNAASIELDYEYLGDIVHYMFGLEEPQIQLGDIILECDGELVTKDNSYRTILRNEYGLKYIGDHGYLNLQEDTNITFKVLRNNVEMYVNVKPFHYVDGEIDIYYPGIDTYNYYIINGVDEEYAFSIQKLYSTGPSGGLIQSFFIYEALTGGKLSKNLKIVGTGTVEADGSAGEIGGIKQKVYSANFNNADIFFVPSSNYEEALTAYNKLNTSMKLISVDSLQDIITYLESLVEVDEK